jgi:hypothetical protein
MRGKVTSNTLIPPSGLDLTEFNDILLDSRRGIVYVQDYDKVHRICYA